jgi:hypothetical protein
MRAGSRVSWIAAAAAVAFGLCLAAPLAAQDFRGSIVGTVSDATGGVLPGVSVTITNTATGVAQQVVTDDKGRYQVRYLNSGTYNVSAQLTGFKTIVRAGNEVRVGDVLPIDLALETGGLEDTVEVHGAPPVLDTQSGVTGTVIDSNQIRELPLADGTAYMLTRLAPGVVDNSDLHFSRPMDNAGLSGIQANGAQGGNDFTLDGAPNVTSTRGVAFSPPSDAISEFKVSTNAFDAQTGHTAGAQVNLALKTGANAHHGSVAYFNRDDTRSATPLFTERAGGEKPTRTYNRAAVSLSGPIRRDRTFFMLAYEYLRDVQPEPSFYTVPTMKMRQGDFSEFPSVTIYDPRTSTGSTNQRTAFPDNRIPTSRIHPVAANYLSYYPEPNREGVEDNFFTDGLRPYDYNSFLARFDHNLSAGHKLFLTGYWNKRREDRYDWAGVVNGFAVTQGFDFRSNKGGTLGYTAALSSQMVLDVRAAWSVFGENREPAQPFDPATLGFSAPTVALMGGYDYMPLFTFASFSAGTNANSTIAALGAQRSDYNAGFDRPFTNLSFAPTLTRVVGSHSLRGGYELRHRRWEITDHGYPGGRFHFNGAYTRANNGAPTNNLAQSWAQFMLGLPTTVTGAVATPGTVSSQIDTAALGEYSQRSHGLFVQDDWRVTPKLTLNVGVRLEIDEGMRETQDRNLRGFDTTSPNPIEPSAQAAYARNPIPEIPVADFRVRGGVLFADGATYGTAFKPLPRLAGAYLLNPRTVLRGGAGLFSFPYYFDNRNQAGFSAATPAITTNDNGATFVGDLSNPFPSGTLVEPQGSAPGLASSLGQNLGNLVQHERKTPYYLRWQASVQRDLGSGWVAEVMYVGASGRHLPSGEFRSNAYYRAYNGVPAQYLSSARARDTGRESYLTTSVPNPMQGLLPGSTINGATVQRQQLLRPFPEFGDVFIEEYEGSDQYHAGTLRMEKRFAKGNSLVATYTLSRLRDKRNFLNSSDPEPEDRLSPDDRPHRVTLGATFRLPFGRGQAWGSDWTGVKNTVLGGWQLSASYQYQSGFPISFNNSLFYAEGLDPRTLKSNIGKTVDGKIAGLDFPAWDISGFYNTDASVQTNGALDPAKQRADSRIALGSANLRYFPSTLPGLRNDDLHLLDVGLYKTFSLPREATLQVRMEVVNALNYTVLWNPNVDPRNANFGFVNQDRNNPRDIQLGARLTF